VRRITDTNCAIDIGVHLPGELVNSIFETAGIRFAYLISSVHSDFMPGLYSGKSDL
jgi:hypothetical protein